MILQMISYTKSCVVMCTLNFYDIVRKCMISYMILNNISIFHIVWYLFYLKMSMISSGILYPWTGSGKMVHTGTYQYVPVQHGISQYENLTVVRAGMYWYIPVRTFNKTSCFLTHPERVRRDKIKVVHLLCMGYNVTQSNFKTAQV